MKDHGIFLSDHINKMSKTEKYLQLNTKNFKNSNSHTLAVAGIATYEWTIVVNSVLHRKKTIYKNLSN